MSQPAHIPNLPDEVLLNIVDQFIAVVVKRKHEYNLAQWLDQAIKGRALIPHEASEYAHAELARLARVSRRFHAIVTQILYRTVVLNYVGETFRWDCITHYHGRQPAEQAAGNKKTGMHFLYRTLMESPALRKHCRTLRLSLAFHESEEAIVAANPALMESVVRNMFTWLSNTTKLEISYDEEPYSDDILATISNNLSRLQKVRKLNIQGREHILLPDLYYGIIRKLPSLETLGIEEAGRRHGRINYAKKFPPLKPGVQLPPPSLSSIIFHGGFEDDPPNLAWFLRQPLQLEHFTFELRYRDHGDWNAGWSLPTLFSLLRSQASTLRTIDIGILYTGRGGALESVDLSAFTRLEELTLPYWDIEIDIPTAGSVGYWESHLGLTEGHAAILSAPHLRKLTICFERISRIGGQRMGSFGEEQENWLRELVLTAARGKKELEKVHLDYTPGSVGRRPKGVEVWPWARVNRVRELEEVRRAGIEVTYETPDITEEEFDKLEGLE